MLRLYTNNGGNMGFVKLASAAGAAALLACVVSTRSESQEAARMRAPIVRIYSQNGSDAINASTYVMPVIQVAENAYVFAVAMDLDGQIQVLHPDFPGISVKLAAHRQVSLPNFFAGFSQPMERSYYTSASFLGYDYGGSVADTRGTVIALASRAPFNLEKIEAGGDWNMSMIRRLIHDRPSSVAAQSLAAYIGAKGEPIGRDFMRFAGGGSYYANNAYAYDVCYAAYGYGFASLRGAQSFALINYLNQRGIGYRIAGFDLCGTPIVVPAGQNVNSRFPFTRPPRNPGDTTVFPKARFPHEGVPRHPREASAEGVFPLPRRAGLGQMGDVTITAPTTRRGEPREILQGYRPTPGGMSVPEGRLPIERPVTPRTEPSAIGAQPIGQYRPEPRVESPPPSRMPETPRASSPPPVIHSAPPSAPPPPRVETPTTKS